MDNILYLDDYINLYNKENHKLIIAKPYKNTLRNGKIIDREKFKKKFKNTLEKYELKESIFRESLIIIINNLFSKEDKILIKDIMEDLNYKNITYIHELDYLKINKKTLLINCNHNYFYFLYTNKFGNTNINIYINDNLNKKNFLNLISILNKENIVLYGKNYKEFKNILEENNINYYFYDNADNLIINVLLNNKKV